MVSYLEQEKEQGRRGRLRGGDGGGSVPRMKIEKHGGTNLHENKEARGLRGKGSPIYRKNGLSKPKKGRIK